MNNCVHIEWAVANPPPTREIFDVCKQSGQTNDQWRAAVHAAIDSHWALHPGGGSQCVAVSWEVGVAFTVCPTGGQTSAQFLTFLHTRIDEEWAISPPQS